MQNIQLHLYKNGARVADIHNFSPIGKDTYEFICTPAILDSDSEYIIKPVGGAEMKIFIANINFHANICKVTAVEISYKP